MWKVARIHSVASQTSHPAIKGTSAHQRLWVAVRVTSPIRTIPTIASRRPSTSMLAKPSASRTGGPTIAGRPSLFRAAKRSAFSRSLLTVDLTSCSPVFLSRTTTAVVLASRSISVPTKSGCFVNRAFRSASALASAERTAPPTERALLPWSLRFLIASRIARWARSRRKDGSRSISISPSSTFQSRGMASIDSTRATPGMVAGPTSRASSSTRSIPPAVRRAGSS